MTCVDAACRATCFEIRVRIKGTIGIDSQRTSPSKVIYRNRFPAAARESRAATARIREKSTTRKTMFDQFTPTRPEFSAIRLSEDSPCMVEFVAVHAKAQDLKMAVADKSGQVTIIVTSMAANWSPMKKSHLNRATSGYILSHHIQNCDEFK